MKEVRTILEGETKKRAEFRNLIHENVTAESELQTVEHLLNENGMFRLFQKLQHKGKLESTVIKGFAVDLKSIFR